jgi:hypothetical protein
VFSVALSTTIVGLAAADLGSMVAQGGSKVAGADADVAANSIKARSGAEGMAIARGGVGWGKAAAVSFSSPSAAFAQVSRVIAAGMATKDGASERGAAKPESGVLSALESEWSGMRHSTWFRFTTGHGYICL